MSELTPIGAVRRLPLGALLLANTISETGNYLAGVALPWFVLLTTGSAAKTGIVAFFQLFPLLLAGILGGPLVDRIGYKRMSVAGDLLGGCTIAMIPFLLSTAGLAFWQLLLFVFVSSLVDNPGDTGRQSLLPDLARQGALPLERVNAAAQSTRRFAILAGPVLAGILITAFGATTALWLDAASFIFSALLVALFVPAHPGHANNWDEQPRAAWSAYLSDLRTGLHFVRHTSLVIALILMFGAVNILLNPLFIVVLPVYAKVAFGSALPLGLMLGAFGLGTLVGTLLFAAIGPRLPRYPLLVGALLVIGLPLWPLILLPSVPVTMLLLMVMGVALGPTGPLIMTILGERTPSDLRGRVFGTVGTLLNAGTPIGVLLVGVAVQTLGLRLMLSVFAIVYLLLSLSVVMLPIFRRLSTLTPAFPPAMPTMEGAERE